MSLSKLTTKVKSGIGQVQSMSGIKSTLVHLGLGFAIGAVVDLVLEYIWRNAHVQKVIAENLGENYQVLEGFTIFPNNTNGYNKFMKQADGTFVLTPTTGISWMAWDDVLLLISTILLLFSKKFWLVIGYFFGWYVSSYMGIYTSIGLPLPEE